MSLKTKSILRKAIYAILFMLCIGAFIYLGEKYTDDERDKIITINDYYSELDNERYEVINGNKMKKLLQEGKNIIFIGSKNSEYSQKYIKELDFVLKSKNIDKIYYYDIVNDKSQKNSNYYEIRELLNGYLTTTDGSTNNLLAPSFYIVDEGEVKYYNIETVAMKNTDTIDSYWNEETESRFFAEISVALDNYYLN